MIDYNEIYIQTSQPNTCPKCSSRTDILLDLSHTTDETQIHKCMNPSCKEEFVVQYDTDFDNESLE